MYVAKKVVLLVLLVAITRKLWSLLNAFRILRKILQHSRAGQASFGDPDSEPLHDDPALPTTYFHRSVREQIQDCKERGTTLWGDYLNSLGFRESSPIRPYITTVFQTQLEPGLRQVFDKLGQKLTLTDLLDISENLRGNIHVLNNMESETTLAGLEEAEKKWMFKRIPRILPTEDLENFDVVQAWMEFVIVRRVVKTLFYSITSKTWLQRIELLSHGLSINIVIDISLTITGRDGEPFCLRLHTVTPRSSSDISRIEE
eukprot:GEMP01091134.1.p1 GENE.GEMP01091134.1~~GEMP01091134.1.p1  ORF type:complete len:259 (+),score=35.84 GEMP01091134.1:91-867(+)